MPRMAREDRMLEQVKVEMRKLIVDSATVMGEESTQTGNRVEESGRAEIILPQLNKNSRWKHSPSVRHHSTVSKRVSWE